MERRSGQGEERKREMFTKPAAILECFRIFDSIFMITLSNKFALSFLERKAHRSLKQGWGNSPTVQG